MWIFSWQHHKFGKIEEGPFSTKEQAENDRNIFKAKGVHTTEPVEVPEDHLIDKGVFLGQVVDPREHDDYY